MTHIKKIDKIENNETSDLIYINDDRFIIVQLLTYIEPVQLSYQESKDIIKTLLLTQKTNELIKIKSEEQRDNLNAGLSNLDTSFKTFVGTMDSNCLLYTSDAADE